MQILKEITYGDKKTMYATDKLGYKTMIPAIISKKVVYVVSVRRKRRPSLPDPNTKYTKSVQYGYQYYTKSKNGYMRNDQDITT
jgi:hypothetical protein